MNTKPVKPLLLDNRTDLKSFPNKLVLTLDLETVAGVATPVEALRSLPEKRLDSDFVDLPIESALTFLSETNDLAFDTTRVAASDRPVYPLEVLCNS